MYSTNPLCPKCKVLEKKLGEANIDYNVIDNIDELKKTGFEYFPILKVDGNILDFKQAIEWVKDVTK